MIMRHNEIRDITAELLNEVCKDVQIEPKLADLTGEVFKLKTAITDQDARLDISARGFWGRGNRAMMDVRVFNPLAKSYEENTLKEAHSLNEKSKKRSYNQRVIEVEHSSFTPLVFSCYGGLSKECSTFYKKLAELLAEKKDIPYPEVASYVRTRLTFSLIRVSVICLRGWRGNVKEPICDVKEIDIPSVVEDANLQINL